jgi:hypothetical protein
VPLEPPPAYFFSKIQIPYITHMVILHVASQHMHLQNGRIDQKQRFLFSLLSEMGLHWNCFFNLDMILCIL